MTLATSPEQAAVCAAMSDWAARAEFADRARLALEKPQVQADGWVGVFAQLADFGVFAAAIPEELGGLGASVADALAMIEQCGHDLVPGPIVETVAAAVVLARSADPRVRKLLAQLMEGASVAVVARSVRSGDGGALDLGAISGYTDGATILVAPSVPSPDSLEASDSLESLDSPESGAWRIIPPHTGVIEATAVPTLDSTRPVARVSINHLGADDVIAVDDRVLVDGLLASGHAAYASGMTRWALQAAVDYAKVRTQFGVPIGSFQAVKHICAEMLCRATQMEAAAWDLCGAVTQYLDAAPDDETRRNADAGPSVIEQLELCVMVADVLVADLPVDTAKDCIQVLGGIGFTYEHNAHLYLRGALAMRAAVAGADEQRRELGRRSRAGLRRHFTIDLSSVDDQRAEVRRTCERIGAATDSAQRELLASSGYLTPHWPRPHGLAAEPALQLLIDTELERAGVTRPDLVIGAWAIPTILEYGTAAQQQRFVAPTLAGEIVWCQLFSEPEAGSDLAGVRTRATRVEGGWELTGQKIWTSQAHNAHWGICLARTDTDVPKHKGITYFLVDMETPGIDVRPLRELTGRANFNEVFLDAVFVPDDCVVGEPGAGWRLARTTLANERVAMGGSGLGKEMGELFDLLAQREQPLNAAEQTRLGSLVAQAHIGRVLDAQAVTRRLDGHDPGALSSVRKLIGVAHRQAVPEFAFDLLGPDAVVASDAAELLLQNRCLSIAGGTTQILRTTAAERILGLPRT